MILVSSKLFYDFTFPNLILNTSGNDKFNKFFNWCLAIMTLGGFTNMFLLKPH